MFLQFRAQLLMVTGHFEENVALAVASATMGVVKRSFEQRMSNQRFVDQVAVIDTTTATLSATIDGVGSEPWGATMAGVVGYCH